ncbi:hypothetical protein HHI36_021783 [Cryptolaemus montrouzieri]|uniref:Uncharacterized protein n=1 Tax=Cryptolaemus montrouzieri TaxID=559131 RepID=A0ABD2MXS7_9CUCU
MQKSKKLPDAPQNTPKSSIARKSERSILKINHSTQENSLKSRKQSEVRKRGFTRSSITFSKLSADPDESQDVHCSCERIKNELFLFIDEFITSQEYMDYVEFKKSVVRKDEEVQYDLNDLVEKEVKPRKKVDVFRELSRKALRVFFLELQVERYAVKLATMGVVRMQEEAIRVIREKIAEVKAVFFCHKNEREARKEEKQQSLVKKFINAHNIDVSRMVSTKRLGQIILEIDRKLRMKRRGHKNNIKSIVEKLINEFKQKRSVRKKWIFPKLKKKDRESNKILHIQGRKDICLQIPYVEDKYKITLDNYAKERLGTVKSFLEFEDLLEARHFFCLCERERREKERAELYYADDSAFVANPSEISIKAVIVSSSLSYQICHFQISPDEIRVVPPGLSLTVSVKFRPNKDMDVVLGFLVFLTCNKSEYCKLVLPIECIPLISEVNIEPEKLSFGTVPIWKFVKHPPDLYKLLKIKCTSDYSHKLVVKKVEDPLQLEQTSEQIPVEEQVPQPSLSLSDDDIPRKTQAELDVEEILGDILKEVISYFRMDRRFLIINKNSGEQRIRVGVSDVKRPGFYMEKYRVDMYKVMKGFDEYEGMQIIIMILEVSDHEIKFEPLCVDFGICFFETGYQTSFELINNSNVTQSVAINIPSPLHYYISSCEKCVFVRSKEKRKIILKFLPSRDLLTDKNKYFDPDTFILYFPIQLKLLNKQFADAPPLIQHGYAIVNDASDLTLDPTGTEHYRLLGSLLELDMGDCYVNEAVTTNVILRNSSYSTRYFCFPDLPRFITIMPNYGIGSLHAFQEIHLKLYICPQIEDFQKDAFRPYPISDEKNIKIFVETIGNLGKYRRKPDMKRLQRLMKFMLKELDSTTDIGILEKIFIAKFIIRTEMNLCTCASTKPTQTSTASLKDKGDDSCVELKEAESGLGSQMILKESDLPAEIASVSKKKKKRSKLKSSSVIIKPVDEKEDAVEKTSSAELIKRKRRSSRLKSISNIEVDIARKEEIEKVQSERPSLLEKKAISALSTHDQKTPLHSLVNLTGSLCRELQLKMHFLKPFYEFSFNHIEFPPTPGASYSIMTTELRPLKNSGRNYCFCGYQGRQKEVKCQASFRIAGSTSEVRIEPTCGVLSHGESIKLTLVATPKINDEVVAAYAFDRRKSAIFQQKMEVEIEKRREISVHKQKRKSKIKLGKKTIKEKEKETPEGKNELSIHIEVASEEVQLGYLDYYPAEIALWRSIEPYFLNTSFVCYMEYETDDNSNYPPDVFTLETICKVVPPEFIHDQKSQRLDFGQVPIGDSKKRIITIQNLKYHDIIVTTSILRPDGNFSCPNFDSVSLPSESFLKIPVTYTSTREESVQEYMEIKAERTIYQFVLTAESVSSNVRTQPGSKVIRVTSKRGKTLEVPFEIVNDSTLPVTVTVEKVCELVGRMRIYSRSPTRSDLKLQKKKTGVETASRKGSFAHGKRGKDSSTEELTEDEIISIQNNFSLNEDNPHFTITHETKRMTIAESSKRTAKILFGLEGHVRKSISQTSHLGKKKKKKDNKSVTEHIVSLEEIGKVYVAKFNVLIGSSSFLRDFILIGEVE